MNVHIFIKTRYSISKSSLKKNNRNLGGVGSIIFIQVHMYLFIFILFIYL